MIRPVYQISRRQAVNGAYVIAVFLHIAVGIILKGIIGGVNVDPTVVFHPARICTEPLGKEGIVLPILLEAGCRSYPCEQLLHSDCINGLGFNGEFLDLADQEALDQYCVSHSDITILVHVCCKLCIIVCKALDESLSFQSQICTIDSAVKIQIPPDHVFAFPGTLDHSACHCADCFIHIEVIGGFRCFDIQLQIGGIRRDRVIGVTQLNPLSLDGVPLCNGGILGISVSIRIL